MRQFTLEIHQPGSTDSVLVAYDSDLPFNAIAAGDLLTLPGRDDSKRLYVSKVEHVIMAGSKAGVTYQKTILYTGRSNGDTDGLRRG